MQHCCRSVCTVDPTVSWLWYRQIQHACGVQERSDDRITPRYLKVSTRSSGLPSRNMGGIFCFLFRDTVMHLDGFKVSDFYTPNYLRDHCLARGTQRPRESQCICIITYHLQTDSGRYQRRKSSR